LSSQLEPEHYPVEELPPLIRNAVEEVQAFSQAPVPLVACSALGALSLAVQGHIDVERASGLDGPVGLYVLVIAASSERKSSVDAKFTEPIRAWEQLERKRLEHELNAYKADMDAWHSRYEGILASIKSKALKGDPTETEEAQLRDLRDEEPEPPKVPHLIYSDVTPEALAFGLAKGWPSAGIVCAEGGTVLGAHGMNADSISRNLALLNSLFSGEGLDVVRKTSESFRVDGARLTVNLAVQAEVLQAFHVKSGGLARGSGFWSRFLLAWPTTTRGKRMFQEAPKLWPALSAYQRRLTDILSTELPLDEDGRLRPMMMRMSPDAFELWRSYYNTIEAQQRPGAELAEISDVAGKSAENVARVAALFHYLEHGASGLIGAAAVKSAVLIVAWHLSESRRFFGELALAEELLDATRLNAYLLDMCRRDGSLSIGKRHVQQHGPVRHGKRLEAAMAVLVEADRVRVDTTHRPHTIHLNPSLLRGAT
jgi:putative DNA primase/helicase